MGPVVASQPGFLAVIGGPIAASSWMYFCGKFATPDDMNAYIQSETEKWGKVAQFAGIKPE